MKTTADDLKEYGIVERRHNDVRVVQLGTVWSVSVNGRTISPKQAVELALKLKQIDDALSHKISSAATQAQDSAAEAEKAAAGTQKIKPR